MPLEGTTRALLPKLSPLDEALFNDLASDADRDLPTIAARHNISTSLAAQRIVDEPITAYLAALNRFTAIRENSRQSLALTRLTKLMDSSPDPAEQRRAATAVLDASFKLLYPPRNRAAQPTSAIPSETSAQTAPSAPSAPSRPLHLTHANAPPQEPQHRSGVSSTLQAPPKHTPSPARRPAAHTNLAPQLSTDIAPHISSLTSPLVQSQPSLSPGLPGPRARSPGMLAIAAGLPP